MNPASYQTKRIFTLNEPNAPRLNPALACEIGLNESLLLLQLEFWISISNNERDGNLWTYQSVRDIQEKAFPFWGTMTINRAIKSLEESGYIITTTKYNHLKYDKTRWISLNFEKLSELHSISIKGYGTRSYQNGTGSNQNGTGSYQDGTTIPETTAEIITETTTTEQPPPILPDKKLPLSFFSSHDLKDLLQSIPQEKRSVAVEKVIEKALLNHSIDDIKIAIAYTIANSKGSKTAFKAYLGKTIDNGWYIGFLPEPLVKTPMITESEIKEDLERQKIQKRHNALIAFKAEHPEEYRILEERASLELGINLKKLKIGETLKIKFRVMELLNL